MASKWQICSSDVVDMASNATLFLTDHRLTYYSIRLRQAFVVFDSYLLYPILAEQFSLSNGATLLNSTLQTNSFGSPMASIVWYYNTIYENYYMRLKGNMAFLNLKCVC